MRDLIITIYTCIFKCLSILPLNSHKIIFMSQNGNQYSCNPKYIFENMYKKYGDDYKYVWIFKKPSNYKMPLGVVTVKYGSIKSFIEFYTSKIIVDNTILPAIYRKRKQQFFFNTWHGAGPYKADSFPTKQHGWLKMQNNQADCFVSSSEKFTKITLRKFFGYTGEVLEVGMPRNDIFYKNNSNIREKVKRFLKISEDTKLLLYAPTWRTNEGASVYNLKFDELQKVLEDRFEGKWKILVRVHHNYKFKINDDGICVDVGDYENMQELICAADMLITDYSSTIWDFSLTKKPIILYVPDLENYIKNRGLVSDIETWGFSICKNNIELQKCIRNFNIEKYMLQVQKHHEEYGICGNGHATDKCVQYLVEKLGR